MPSLSGEYGGVVHVAKPISAPNAERDDDAIVLSASTIARAPFEQQLVATHDSVDALRVHALGPLAVQQRCHAVGRSPDKPLMLYLDFINLFLYLLRLFGRRR
jgi:hypothetical protein